MPNLYASSPRLARSLIACIPNDGIRLLNSRNGAVYQVYGFERNTISASLWQALRYGCGCKGKRGVVVFVGHVLSISPNL
jgi:hypothetical protein